MKGIIGKFFFQFGVTISVAVLISLLEALTLAPMRLSRMLEVGQRAGRARAARWPAASPASPPATSGCWCPRSTTAGACWLGALVLFVLSLGIVRLLPREFVPTQDMSRFMLRF